MSVITTSHGRIRGSEEAGGVLRFAGIPFAAPPVGELRWRPPQPPEPWEGVRDASRFGNTAIQTIDTKMIDFRSEVSEDCLYLNVWTTTTDASAKQPVMFWIHGGGFLNGTSSADAYDGAALAEAGVTVVSVNYRLGAFGFFNHDESGTNFGLLDWIAGLEWVRANAANFGGDPDNVLIFGQSAGAAAVRALMHAPAARGLFHRAIIMSAGYDEYAHVSTPSFERTRIATDGLLARLGAASVDEARLADAEQVRVASLAESGIFPPEGQLHTPANLVWYPAVDGATMVDGFGGWPHDVPVMIGVTDHEARLFVQPNGVYAHPEIDPAVAYTPDVLDAMAVRLAGDRAEAVVDAYSENGATPYEAIADLISEAVWFEPLLATLDHFARDGRTAYAYRFTRVSPGNRESGMLSYHSSEVPYVLGNLVEGDKYERADVAVSRSAQGAWVSFARGGTPLRPDGTPWSAYRVEEPVGEVIDVQSAARPLVKSRVGSLIAELRTGVLVTTDHRTMKGAHRGGRPSSCGLCRQPSRSCARRPNRSALAQCST
ncbi:carboxylesterase/lipase family protein [Agromyces subbeticus]|uniref:carboxylesterase/lipase family protein n=1 Tax=Agromyces subbeticus TaxID=293890 RepID=UPI0003B40128|nr:carboxylesterase family protein [Agromyces subbeticus]